MAGIFISYRRDDTSGYAGRLFDILSTRFGREHTYMDLDTIKGGDNFVAVIEDKVRQCDVLLALIGERWVTITGEDGTTRRLDMPGDFVRLEIAKALARKVRVIPVLVGGASMPHEADLPDDLRPLALHQAMDLRDAHFHADTDLLIDLLDRTVPGLSDRPKLLRLKYAAGAALAIAALLGGAVLYRQTRADTRPAANPVVLTPAAPVANVAGTWKAAVKYDWGDTSAETFDFETTGQELSGTASLLGYPRGIFDGRIDGNRLSFMTKTLTSVNDKTSEDKHHYKGTIDGDTIQFTMLTDSSVESHVPIRFTATRTAAKSRPTP
jgi:hypothetical protein